jgi:hypothetical protein
MTTYSPTSSENARTLRHISENGSISPGSPVSSDVHPHGLSIPVAADLREKLRAMERLRRKPFVADANEPRFEAAQRWIEQCGLEVALPLNFCGGLLMMRVYRLITPASEQTPRWMEAVYSAAAAYDFAFLALALADDEADLTAVRNELPTRFVTHPDTRAVDAINLLLVGVTAMKETLDLWPNAGDLEPEATRHPLAMEVMAALMRALREASFPILLDRAGLGHTVDALLTTSELGPILIDAQSLERVEAFTRYRAHTYLLRATELATILAGYANIEHDLAAALDELFELWGLLGAAMDDLQDLIIDFSAGVHSICTVMAHLCVAEDPTLRPAFRREIPEGLVRDQRRRLAGFFGAPEAGLDRDTLVILLDEIGLRQALAEHLEGRGTLFAAAIYRAATKFGFSTNLMTEIVSVVCGDPQFAVPEIYHTALETITDEMVLGIMNVQVGRFITAYFVGRFWPANAERQ